MIAMILAFLAIVLAVVSIAIENPTPPSVAILCLAVIPLLGRLL